MGKKGEGNGSGRKDKGKEEQAADRDTGQVEFDSPFFCSFDHSIIFEYENENMQQEMATALQTLQMDIWMWFRRSDWEGRWSLFGQILEFLIKLFRIFLIDSMKNDES